MSDGGFNGSRSFLNGSLRRHHPVNSLYALKDENYQPEHDKAVH
jgi:hypothetical protein